MLTDAALTFLTDFGRDLRKRHGRPYASEWVRTLLHYMQEPDEALGPFIAELDGEACIEVEQAVSPRGERQHFEQGGLF